MEPGVIGVQSRQEIISRFSRHVSSGKVRFFQSAGIDFVLGRREGAYLWDVTGATRLIDCHCNGGVFNLGHRNPRIIEALVAGLRNLDIGNHHLISQPRANLASKLASLTWEDAYVVFGVGGGEAVDLAIKVARAYTTRTKVISAKGGYHGHTGLALAAGDEKYRAPFGPLAPGFIQVPFREADALERAVDADTAAVILETVPATNGMPIPDQQYLSQVRELCDRKGALLIIDEVQTGLGRTGKMWGIDHFAVEPDIMVIGKGLSGGIYPMSATVFRAEFEVVFHSDPFIHVSTFGGAEVGCAVAFEVLEILADRDFLSHVNDIAAVFKKGFADLSARHPDVLVGLRQLGLMMGIEMVDERCGPLFTKKAFDNGLLSVYANNDPRVAQLLPPLTIDRSLASEILERVDESLAGVKGILA
jgi:putrescine aminotransferase